MSKKRCHFKWHFQPGDKIAFRDNEKLPEAERIGLPEIVVTVEKTARAGGVRLHLEVPEEVGFRILPHHRPEVK